MSEVIDRASVAKDDAGEWWLEFYADNIRHQTTIVDVLNGLASFVNMQVTNAVLHEKNGDAEADRDRLAAENAKLRAALSEMVSMLKYGEHYDIRLLYGNGAKLRDEAIVRAAALLKKD